MYVFKMEVTDVQQRNFLLSVKGWGEEAVVSFHYDRKYLSFLTHNALTSFLKANEYQFRKILHIKQKQTWYKGFQLQFSLRDKKDVAAFNDTSNIVVLDKRYDKDISYVVTKSSLQIPEVYTDGSFLKKYGKGGFVVLIKNTDGAYKLHEYTTNTQSSSLIELEAAIKAIELLEPYQKIRMVTDSQYVRKGLTEWIYNWKLNDWTTANGVKVKNIAVWQFFDKITNGKYIEFVWVKSHSGHFENTMCDLYAKDMAKGVAFNK
jgi:ribonuclease HI